MFSSEQLKGSINTVDRQLLFDIRNLLIEQNTLLKNITTESQPDEIDTMKRQEVMKQLKQYENPKGWHHWSTDKMKDHLREVILT
ncbi:MAG: hypothetical protein WD491_02575 [Balneolales bacterium]